MDTILTAIVANHVQVSVAAFTAQTLALALSAKSLIILTQHNVILALMQSTVVMHAMIVVLVFRVRGIICWLEVPAKKLRGRCCILIHSSLFNLTMLTKII